VVVPAGSLDDEAPLKPQARIFTESRASWSTLDLVTSGVVVMAIIGAYLYFNG